MTATASVAAGAVEPAARARLERGAPGTRLAPRPSTPTPPVPPSIRTIPARSRYPGRPSKSQPNAESRVQDFPALPPFLKPSVPATNLGLLGYAFDASTSPKFLSLIHIHAGRLAASGDPRGWKDGELTPLSRFIEAFRPIREGKLAPGGAEAYWPRRLSLDLGGAGSLVRTKTSDYLGLRTWYGKRIDIPFYAFQTSLPNGRVLASARALVKQSRIPISELESDTGFAHLDPLAASPDRNVFLRRVIPFLKGLR